MHIIYCNIHRPNLLVRICINIFNHPSKTEGLAKKT